MEKNNLEELYKEKLKDFNELPEQHVWESITASLDKKKKKRIIPIWFKLGGVAALLAFLFYMVNLFEDSTSPISEITDVENTSDKIPVTVKDKQPYFKDNSNENSLNATEVAADDNTNEANINRITTTKTNEKEETYTSNSNSKNIYKNVGQNNTNRDIAIGNTTPKEKQNQIDYSKISEKSLDTKLASSKTKKEEEKQKFSVAQNTTEAIPQTTENKKNNKKSIFDVIEKQKEEELAIAEKKGNKWSVGPSVAPVYFDAIGQGSPIHPDFIENSKSGNVNLSYGLTVAYNLGKRLKIRSGIHKIDYGYDTDEVVFSSSITQNSVDVINNINFSETSRTIVVGSKENRSRLSNVDTNGFSQQSLQREGSLSQQIGYLEVPLELNYTLIDRKVGVNLIGGLSSLFLVDNSVSLESQGLITEVGEANNINTVNFSTNFGVGFSYKLSPKIYINVDPIFKYQLNTFSDTAGDFNPYSIGVYSGLRLNF